MARARDLDDRLLNYAARVMKVVEQLPRTVTGRRIGDQLLRCSTSIGANYEEAQAAESRADFIHKLQLSLKELRESHYWLRLLGKTGLISASRIAEILGEAERLRAILSKSVATAKRNSCLLPLAFCLLPVF